jgi:hypothetical protein
MCCVYARIGIVSCANMDIDTTLLAVGCRHEWTAMAEVVTVQSPFEAMVEQDLACTVTLRRYVWIGILKSAALVRQTLEQLA